jgi:hypothetical protein
MVLGYSPASPATYRIQSTEYNAVYYFIELIPVSKYLEEQTGSVHMELIDAQFYLSSMNSDTQWLRVKQPCG